MSIGLVIAAAIAVCLVVLIISASVSILQSERTGLVAKSAVVLALVVLIALPVYILTRLQRTPPARAISDAVSAIDASDQLAVTFIAMPAPLYAAGTGTIEKTYASKVVVDVSNTSDREVYVGLEYYANAGLIGLYSPGATQGASIVVVRPNWSGKLRFPLRHTRFVPGGHVKLALSLCTTAASGPRALPAGSELLLEKTYHMVAAGSHERAQ